MAELAPQPGETWLDVGTGTGGVAVRAARAGAWDPEGGIGASFRLLARFQPPPPQGAGNPLDWGREEHARELLEGDFDLRFVRGSSPQTGKSGEEVWELSVTSFGPMKTLYESLDEGRREELHKAYVDFYDSRMTNGRVEAPREYLMILGTRR
ncbi:MAG: hypothetical protein M3O92_02050 [Actinomycetota bacterium]|nr:hypothetical protein [Actinomycetota bacterium]